MPTKFKALPVDYLALKPLNLIGVQALSYLLNDTSSLPIVESKDDLPVPEVPSLAELLKALENKQHGLIVHGQKGRR